MSPTDQRPTASVEPNLPDAETLTRIVRTRHSCRGFLPESVARTTIERILDVSQRSASWCNSQAWQIYLTEGAGTDRFREALSAHAVARLAEPRGGPPQADIAMPLRYAGVYRERRKASGLQLYGSMGIRSDDPVASGKAMLRNFSLFDAPHVAILTTPTDLGCYGAVDCGSFISTFMTVAWAYGVASIAQGAIAAFSPFVRDYFGVEEGRQVVCAISFGYEDVAHPANQFRTARASLAEVVTWVEG